MSEETEPPDKTGARPVRVPEPDEYRRSRHRAGERVRELVEDETERWKTALPREAEARSGDDGEATGDLDRSS